MKHKITLKEAQALNAESGYMQKINRYTRRKLGADEVFVFSVILCDNEIDRDGEQFSEESLNLLGELFVGKTGVLDHDAKAENQSARIFDTQVVKTEKTNSVGEAYAYLKGWAYMLKCPKNETLMLEIDGGIKKEVSVGCAVEKTVCSICGENVREKSCVHKKGEFYGEKLCYHVLHNPIDAYEWSFVAVPAQKNAGVIKKFAGSEIMLNKLFDGQVSFDEKEYSALKSEITQLRKKARSGEIFRTELEKEVMRLGLISLEKMDGEILGAVIKEMDTDRLMAFKKAFEHKAKENIPMLCQLGRNIDSDLTDKKAEQFKV